jgi:DNA polymerase-3 subunit epsilon
MAAAEGLPPELVFVDLETTGGNAAHDRITEVGILRLKDGELLEEWSSLVNPECPIPDYIESFTGITNEMVAGAPRFADIAATVLDKLQGAVFVAHNARFDYSFLRSEFRNADLRFSAPVLCTVKLSRRLFPDQPRHNLDAVMERNGLSCDARHRALGDARVIHDFWMKLRRDLPDQDLAAVVQGILAVHRLPAHLPPDLADDLPEGPGAYRFFGENAALLYVGKGQSLRHSILSHFSAEESAAKDRRLAGEVRRVEWQESAGELGALLRASAWLRQGRPLFNRRARNGSQSHTLRPGISPPITAVPIDDVHRTDLSECFGVFHSEKDARKALTEIARAQHLCLKVLGIEESEGSCVAYQWGRCKGACVGKEPLILHRTRLQLSLSALKLKTWPFPGRIALRERGRLGAWEFTGGSTELHVLDHWTYLSSARNEEQLAEICAGDWGTGFDVDVYRILVRYFARNPKLDWIDLREMTNCA